MAVRWRSARVGARAPACRPDAVLALLWSRSRERSSPASEPPGPPPPAGVADDLTTWLRANTADGDRIAMTFRDREAMALRLFGSVAGGEPRSRPRRPERRSGVLPVDGPARSAVVRVPPGDLGARPDDPPVRYLALSGPHPFHPTELLPRHGRRAGPGTRAGSRPRRGRATTRRSSRSIRRRLDLPRTWCRRTMSADAALAWLDLAAPVAWARIRRRPDCWPPGRRSSGNSLPALLARLGALPESSGLGHAGHVWDPPGRCRD